MPAEKLTVTWLESAKKLLGKRDRYTQEAIRSEFEHSPMAGGVEFDTDHWVTPVADFRYSVIWKEDAASHTAQVEAIVPARFTGDAESIREQVGKVVRLETKGEVVFG